MAQNKNDNSKTIVGKIEKVIFFDAKSGRSILSVLKEDGKLCHVLGNINGTGKDCTISATGVWRKDDKYGWQFLAESIAEISQMDDKQEPVEDGLIHALDFSNVLYKSHKEFRNVNLRYEYDDSEEDEEYTSDTWEKFVKEFNELDALVKPKPEDTNEPIKSSTKSVGGALYNQDMTKLISAPKDVALFEIPDTVTYIGAVAFADSMLETVTIPHSVTSIGERAFSNCSNLTTATIPDSVTSIGDYAFYRCSCLKDIEIPNSVSSIGRYSFAYCTGLKCINFPESLISVKERAFANCVNLEQVEIGIMGINIDETAFEGCANDPFCNDLEIDWNDVMFQDGSLLVMEGKLSSGIAGKESLGNRVTDKGKKAIIAKIRHQEAKAYMSNILRRLNTSLPRLIIHFEVGSKPRLVNEEALNKTIAILLENRIVKTEEVDWKYVEIEDQSFSISNNSGNNLLTIHHNAAREYMNSILKRISNTLPKLKAHFVEGSDMAIENQEILDDVVSILLENRIIKIEKADWKDVKIRDGYFSISCKSGNYPLIIHEHRAAKPFMNKILKRVSNSLPILEILHKEGAVSKLENKQVLDDVIAILRENIIVKKIEIDWHEIEFLNYSIQLKDPYGNVVNVMYEKAMAFMNKMLKRMADYLPRLIVRFEEGKKPVIGNLDILEDITTLLTQRKDYGELIRANIKSSDVLKALNVISKKDTRVFVPCDKSPYLDFLSENQAIDKYPIVPIEEYIGGGYEDGALFTIIMNGMPHIVWENFNDSRSTYIFKCTEDGYEDMRQRIFDYIVTQESNKRQFLRTDKCEVIFGAKPRLLAHNNLESWSRRLMSDTKSDIELGDYIYS